jgi:hypothetical protein
MHFCVYVRVLAFQSVQVDIPALNCYCYHYRDLIIYV